MGRAPRKSKPKSKEGASARKEGFTPDERLSAPPPPPPHESTPEPETPAALVCPRASVCLHAGDCRQEPDGCGAFTRQAAMAVPAPAGASRSAIQMVHGDTCLDGVEPETILELMQQARMNRENSEGPARLYGDPRTHEAAARRRGERW